MRERAVVFAHRFGNLALHLREVAEFVDCRDVDARRTGGAVAAVHAVPPPREAFQPRHHRSVVAFGGRSAAPRQRRFDLRAALAADHDGRHGGARERILDALHGRQCAAEGRVRLAEQVAAAEAAKAKAAKAKELRGKPGATKDGYHIPLLANVGKPSDGKTALEYGAEGVGLFRSEFLFIGNAEPPSVEEQTKAYAELLAQFPGKKVVIRMLDAGADKPLPFLTPEDEPNPALGLRGLRTLRTHMNVLEGQLKALAAADAQTDADLWVMAPMVADAHEAAYFVKLGKSFGLKKVGVMAEVPSIALMADQVAKVADFVSIGTNDLTQYTLAADRTLGSVANYQTAWHPAVLRAIKLIADAGNANGMPVGVCGEAAADPDLAVVLTGIGVNSLSMTPVALDDVRAELAGVTLEEAQEKAAKALNGDFYNPSEWNI